LRIGLDPSQTVQCQRLFSLHSQMLMCIKTLIDTKKERFKPLLNLFSFYLNQKA
jgi:hypothetical protein